MELREERLDAVTAFLVKGRIDRATAAAFAERLESFVAAPGSRLVVDFGELEYISSAGFRALLVAAKWAEGVGGRLILCSLSDKVHQLFDLGGFLELFSIASSREEAINAAR
jgi:anti-sigma B factor antagonist